MFSSTFKHKIQIRTQYRYYSNRKNVRVRFAPSPTGFLHLGGLRTALYNSFFAKSNSGKFILRIEDTDQTRIVSGATEALIKDLQWSGVEIDEGPIQGGDYGPYIQSKRLEIYKKHVKILLENKSAYHCFCSDRRLEMLRKEAMRAREVPKYDNRCRSLSSEEVEKRLSNGSSSCIRFKLTAGEESFDDLIYGPIKYDVTANEGDPVIMKTDCYPTYHFANVVDDHCMRISHVLRGVEWQISTTKHILMYRAFKWEPPIYGHLPLLINSDGTKLSKRQGDITVGSFRNGGIFPQALVNYISLTGGGFHRNNDETDLKLKCYSMPQLSLQFDISRVNSSPSKLMPERLLDFNRLELKNRLNEKENAEKLIDDVISLAHENLSELSSKDVALYVDRNHVKKILRWSVERIIKLSDLFAKDLMFIWIRPKHFHVNKTLQKNIQLFEKEIGKNPISDKNEFNLFMKKFCETNGIQYGSFMRDLRSILSGLKEGPSVAEIAIILGKDESLERLRNYINLE